MNRSTKIGGGVGIYIANQINYKIRSDLNLSDENIIESIFIELVTAVGKNIIVGVLNTDHQIVNLIYWKIN
jgi:hypothetical protein